MNRPDAPRAFRRTDALADERPSWDVDHTRRGAERLFAYRVLDVTYFPA